jgi:calcineurin-like phosphoesterase family protein
MPDIWAWSDPHFHHTNILNYCSRPFSSVEEMNEKLIQNFNARVKADDIVYCLGDFSLSEKKVQPIMSRLNGKEQHLIVGNHDAAHPCHKKKSEAALKRYLEYGFKTVQLSTTLRLNDTIGNVLLHHMPYTADERHGQKYAEYYPKDDGLWLLHGHSHGAFGRIHGKQIDVGVDCFEYAPVSFEEIAAIIQGVQDG